MKYIYLSFLFCSILMYVVPIFYFVDPQRTIVGIMKTKPVFCNKYLLSSKNHLNLVYYHKNSYYHPHLLPFAIWIFIKIVFEIIGTIFLITSISYYLTTGNEVITRYLLYVLQTSVGISLVEDVPFFYIFYLINLKSQKEWDSLNEEERIKVEDSVLKKHQGFFYDKQLCFQVFGYDSIYKQWIDYGVSKSNDLSMIDIKTYTDTSKRIFSTCVKAYIDVRPSVSSSKIYSLAYIDKDDNISSVLFSNKEDADFILKREKLYKKKIKGELKFFEIQEHNLMGEIDKPVVLMRK